MRPLFALCLFGSSAFVASCAGPEAAPPVSGKAKLAEAISARPLDEASLKQMVAEFIIESGGEGPTILFCTQHYPDDPNKPPSYRPVILRGEKGRWDKLDFDFEPFSEGMQWWAVYESGDGSRIWAIAQWTREDPGDALEIVLSEDAGRTWRHVATVEKPWYLAELQSMSMDASGHGAIVMYIGADSAGSEQSMGYWRSYTQDWGKSWTKPKLEQGDILSPVDAAPDDTPLPELLKRASTTRP